MSTEPIRRVTGARIRAGDSDREQVVEQLGAHHADGRLDLAEFTDRMDAAYRATYLDQLDLLLADVPADVPPAGPAAGPHAGRVPRVRHASPARPTTGVAGGAAALAGRWVRLPLPLLAFGSLALLLSGVALAHALPPFPLFWLAAFVVLSRRWRRGRWSAGPDTGGPHRGPYAGRGYPGPR